MTLHFIKLLHERADVKVIAKAFTTGQVSMASFLHDNLPGFGSYITQLALYLQGLDCSKARDRLALRFDDTRKIVKSIIEQRLQYHEIQTVKRNTTKQCKERRHLIRLAEAEPYRRHHAHVHLFTEEEVDMMNAHRPPEDQLQVMPNGLLMPMKLLKVNDSLIE